MLGSTRLVLQSKENCAGQQPQECRATAARVQGNSRKSARRFGHGSDVGCRNILQRSTNILKSFSTGLRPQDTQHLKTFQRSSRFRPGYGHITFGSSGKALLPQDSRATVQLEEAPHPVAMATGCSAVHGQIHSL